MIKKLFTIGALLAALPVAASAGEPAPDLRAALERHVQSEDRQLFEMCCWARGRAGFSHCAEYGICVDKPGAVCVGRGASEGRELQCPGEDSRTSHGMTHLTVTQRPGAERAIAAQGR